MVNGNTFKEAITVLYELKGLEGEELASAVNETMKVNKSRHEKCFPKRLRINPDGTQAVYMNEYNKFDIETDSIKLD